jgi:hypothetical protein
MRVIAMWKKKGEPSEGISHKSIAQEGTKLHTTNDMLRKMVY